MPRLLLLPWLLLCVGCTTTALGRRTVNQSLSASEARYREVVDNLAVVADNRGTMPSLATLSGGIVNVTNTYGIDPTSTWSNISFASQVLNLTGKHSPEQQWTISPVADHASLKAVYCAYLWAVCGPPAPGTVGAEILRAPRQVDDTDPHFGVDEQLRNLPPNWLGIGARDDVPADACYISHCCNTYVWVRPKDLMALSNFTLVIFDIATVDPNSVVWRPPMATIETKVTPQQNPATTEKSCDSSKSPSITITEKKRIWQKADCQKTIVVPSRRSDAHPEPAFCFCEMENAVNLDGGRMAPEEANRMMLEMEDPSSPPRSSLDYTKQLSIQAQQTGSP